MRPDKQFDFSVFFDGLTDEIVVLGETGEIVAANKAWKNFAVENGGDEQSHYLGSNYFDACSSTETSASAEASLILDGLRKVLDVGDSFRCEYPCDSPTEIRWFELTASRFVAETDRFIVVQHRNITSRHIQREDTNTAFVESEMLAALVATTNDAVLSYDLDGRIITWNRAAQRLYGYTRDEVVGQSLEILYPPDWPKRVAQYRDEIIAGKLASFQATRIAKDGQVRDVWISCAPVRGPDGDIVSISNIHRDISETRKAEEARAMIAREVIHRAKNMLTVVTAIQRQTARSANSFDEFNATFSQRLKSLLASTDLLVSGNWTTVSLAKLVEAQLAPFVGTASAQISTSGPDVLLQPEAVQAVGMAFHELATNSAKHGAMGMLDGEIEIAWRFEPRGNDNTLCIEWIETGISTDKKPGGSGFGQTVLTTLTKSMLDAEVNYEIGAAVNWSVTIGKDHFRAAD